MFLIDTIKHNEKKFKMFLYFFTQLFRRGELQAYKIKPVLFLFMLCFLAATKTSFRTKNPTRKVLLNMKTKF